MRVRILLLAMVWSLSAHGTPTVPSLWPKCLTLFERFTEAVLPPTKWILEQLGLRGRSAKLPNPAASQAESAPRRRLPETEAAFLKAIAAEPHDDLVRLVFADQQEESGHPEYAEYLRASVALRRLYEDPVAFRRLTSLGLNYAQLAIALEQRIGQLSDAVLAHWDSGPETRISVGYGEEPFLNATPANFRGMDTVPERARPFITTVKFSRYANPGVVDTAAWRALGANPALSPFRRVEARFEDNADASDAHLRAFVAGIGERPDPWTPEELAIHAVNLRPAQSLPQVQNLLLLAPTLRKLTVPEPSDASFLNWLATKSPTKELQTLSFMGQSRAPARRSVITASELENFGNSDRLSNLRTLDIFTLPIESEALARFAKTAMGKKLTRLTLWDYPATAADLDAFVAARRREPPLHLSLSRPEFPTLAEREVWARSVQRFRAHFGEDSLVFD